MPIGREFSRHHRDLQVVHGRPVVVGELAGGSSVEEIMQGYHVTNEQIRAALAYSAANQDNQGR